MGPYSHYVLAAKLASSLNPQDRGAYYWGAVVPDIRYLANLRREQTHLSQERIKELRSCYPDLRSFLLGYQVHTLIDQVDVSRAINAAFPLNLLQPLLRKRLSGQRATMLVEMYYLQSAVVGEALSGDHNAVLADLSITPEQTRIFHQGLQEYFAARSLDAALSAFQKIGMIENARVGKYLNAYQAMQKRKIFNSLFLLGVKNARLDAQVIEHVRAGLSTDSNTD